jgi:hypothetical protein
MNDPMSHRERVAVLSLLAMAVTYGPYFTWMSLVPPTAPLPDLRTMSLFAATSITQALLLGAGHLCLRWWWPDDARAPSDERDRAIDRRALRIAYYVLMSGTILVGGVMPFQVAGWQLVNAAIFMVVLSEVVHYAAALWGYRRGWHD